MHCCSYLSATRIESSCQIDQSIDQVTPFVKLLSVTRAGIVQGWAGSHLDHMTTWLFRKNAIILHAPDRSLKISCEWAIASSFEFQTSR